MILLGKCPTCQGQVSVNAKACPHCGEIYFYKFTWRDGEVQLREDFSDPRGGTAYPPENPLVRVDDLRTGQSYRR